jgi:hypothetical protein
METSTPLQISLTPAFSAVSQTSTLMLNACRVVFDSTFYPPHIISTQTPQDSFVVANGYLVQVPGCFFPFHVPPRLRTRRTRFVTAKAAQIGTDLSTPLGSPFDREENWISSTFLLHLFLTSTYFSWRLIIPFSKLVWSSCTRALFSTNLLVVEADSRLLHCVRPFPHAVPLLSFSTEIMKFS